MKFITAAWRWCMRKANAPTDHVFAVPMPHVCPPRVEESPTEKIRRDTATAFLAASIRREGHHMKRAAMVARAIDDADELLLQLYGKSK